MNGLLIFILKASIAQAVLFLFYWIILRKDTYFHINRLYLLVALLLPFLLAVPHEIGNVVITAKGFPFNLPEWNVWEEQPEVITQATTVTSITVWIILKYVYCLVLFIFLLRMVLSFYKIFDLIRKGNITRKDNLCLILLDQPTPAFSFFHWVFIPPGTQEQHPLIDHEKVHADQWHTFDLILADVASALLWFNPFVFFHKQAIRANHEFLADRKVLQEGLGVEHYLSALLDAVTLGQVRGFASHFSLHLTKKRIMMMTQIKSGKFAWIKYVLILPIAGMLAAGLSRPAPAFTGFLNPLVSELQVGTHMIPSIAPYRMEDKKSVTNVSGFGLRSHPIHHQQNFHQGVDFAMPGGLDVLATADGVSVSSTRSKEWGKVVILEHADGYITVYAHLSEVLVKPGEHVKQGQAIGKVGSTGTSLGNHIHYEVWLKDKNLDPLKFIPPSCLPGSLSKN